MAISCMIKYKKFFLATTMDVEALRLLHAQRDALKRLPNPDDVDMTSDKYEAVVTKTMAETKKTIKQVSTYAEKIGDELQTIRELISKCSIKIGEQIKKLMKNNLLKGILCFIGIKY
jgi:glutaredoxin 2